MKIKTTCDRCFGPATVSIMSKLNRDALCLDCKADEKALPSYKDGNAAELDAVKAGNYNFPGVGLTADDQAFLAARRAARKGGAQ